MADEGDHDGGAALEILTSAIAAAGGWYLGALASGGDAMATTAASTAAQVAVARAVMARRAGKAERLLTYSAEEADLDTRLFIETVLADPQLVDLLGMAMDAAVQALTEQKVRVLGRLVAAGVLAEDRATLDVSYQLARIWRDLERPHLIVLDHMHTRSGHVRAFSIALLRGVEPYLSKMDVGLPQLADGMEALVAVLRTHGLVEPVAHDDRRWAQFVAQAAMGEAVTPPEDGIRISSLGEQVLDSYRAVTCRGSVSRPLSGARRASGLRSSWGRADELSGGLAHLAPLPARRVRPDPRARSVGVAPGFLEARSGDGTRPTEGARRFGRFAARRRTEPGRRRRTPRPRAAPAGSARWPGGVRRGPRPGAGRRRARHVGGGAGTSRSPCLQRSETRSHISRWWSVRARRGLGHSDIGITLNTYTHTVSDQHRRAGDLIDGVFE